MMAEVNGERLRMEAVRPMTNNSPPTSMNHCALVISLFRRNCYQHSESERGEKLYRHFYTSFNTPSANTSAQRTVLPAYTVCMALLYSSICARYGAGSALAPVL